jgi:CheY-like chemotaxis protein
VKALLTTLILLLCCGGVMKIAFVDDDRDFREVHEIKLTRLGHLVLPVPNGLQLMRVLKVERPDVVLMDVMMGWIDGISLTQALKKNQMFRDIPVIAMSASHDPSVVARTLAAGAHSFLSKPFSYELLAMRMEEATGREEGELRARVV